MSSQSKDNTCPTCHNRGTIWKDEHSYLMNEQPDFPCPTCSGQQEDTGHPTAETPDAQPLENVSGEQFDGMRATPPYAPIIGPDGEELTFDEVTDSLRRFQFKVERILEEATSRRQVDQAAEMLAWTARQLNRCAQDFVRLPEALPSNNASEAVRVDAPLTDSKPEKPQDQLRKRILKILDKHSDPAQTAVLVDYVILMEEGRILPALIDDLQALLATEYERGYNAAPDTDGDYISLPEQDWKAALKAEYDRGRIDEAKTCEQAKRHDSKAIAKAEYDRGKVEGGVEELKPIAEWEGAMFEEDVRAYVLTRQAELKSKGEV